MNWLAAGGVTRSVWYAPAQALVRAAAHLELTGCKLGEELRLPACLLWLTFTVQLWLTPAP